MYIVFIRDMAIPWYSTIYSSFLFAGIIIIICTIGTPNSSSVIGTIVGYSFIITGILLLTGYLMNNMTASSILSKIVTVGPFLVLLGILIYMIYLLSVFFNRIVNGQVSGGYYHFMNIFVILLMLIFYIFYNGTQDTLFKNSGVLSKVTGMTLYLLEVINIIVIITLAIILQYFSTDG